jgi:hypothetical protein
MPSELASDLLDVLDQLSGGVHPGFRPVHARGVMYSGTFTPSADAAKLTRAPHAVSSSTPVTVRFSVSAGIPTIADNHFCAGWIVKSGRRLSESKSRRHLSEGRFPVAADQKLRLGLRLLPRWLDLSEESLPLGCEPDHLVPTTRWRIGLEPASLLHEFHVPAERGLFDSQYPRDFGGANLAHVAYGRKNVRLADSQYERSEGLVIERGDHSIDQPDADSDALARHPISSFGFRLGLLHAQVVSTPNSLVKACRSVRD